MYIGVNLSETLRGFDLPSSSQLTSLSLPFFFPFIFSHPLSRRERASGNPAIEGLESDVNSSSWVWGKATANSRLRCMLSFLAVDTANPQIQNRITFFKNSVKKFSRVFRPAGDPHGLDAYAYDDTHTCRSVRSVTIFVVMQLGLHVVAIMQPMLASNYRVFYQLRGLRNCKTAYKFIRYFSCCC